MLASGEAEPAEAGQFAWGVLLLPQLEMTGLYDSANFAVPLTHPVNVTVSGTHVGAFICPSNGFKPEFRLVGPMDEQIAAVVPRSDYVASAGLLDLEVNPFVNDGVMYCNSRTRISAITDGTSNSILLGERSMRRRDLAWSRSRRLGVPLAGPFESRV